MKNIIIFGAPGSGKGTYSDEIVAKYGMGHISTGDVLRGEIKNGTELGKIAKGYIDNGQLIPDELMIDILAKTYDAQTKGQGVKKPSRSVLTCTATRRLLWPSGSRKKVCATLSTGKVRKNRCWRKSLKR